MNSILDNAISNELLFVYSLITVVVILIIVIIVLDKRDSKKKPQNLFDTLNMKIIADPNDTVKEFKDDSEVVEIKSVKVENEFKDLEPIQEIKIVDSSNELKKAIESIEEDIYVESDLEKTQAQIRVEEISKALENAEIEEKIEKDKYEQFEEEQEKNAIISYNELMKSFDKLYSENEKIQYLEDDEIPINIDELYKLQEQEAEKSTKKVEIEDFVSLNKQVESLPKKTQESSFKSSPYISPVYGIQQPPIEIKNETDKEIENANQFLQSLKELKSNLD